MYGRSIDKNQPFQIHWGGGIPIELLLKKSHITSIEKEK
jgi:hypothetical protein